MFNRIPSSEMEWKGFLSLLILFTGALDHLDSVFGKSYRPLRLVLRYNNDVGCPETWKAFGNKCYFIRLSPRKTFENAQMYCEMNGGSLVSIHSQIEQDFITANLGESENRGNAWIGLKKENVRGLPSSRYTWDEWKDRTKMNYSNYAPGEPSSQTFEKCFHLENAESVAGRWNDHRCDALKGYACQSKRDVSDEKSFYFGENNCPEGWQSYRDRCFKLVANKKNWDNAEAECQRYGSGSHLVSVSDSFEQAFLSFMISITGFQSTGTDGIWIGLSDKDQRMKGRLAWSDARLVFHTNWGSFKESGNSSEPRCTSINQFKLWDIKDCNAEMPFICAKDLNQNNQSQTVVHGNCPPDWLDFGNEYCYYIERFDEERYTEASRECASKAPKGKLAEFLNQEQMRLVLTYLKINYTDNSFLVGIKAKHNGFHFATNEQLTPYLPWGEDEPNFVNTDKCVELSVRRFSYNNIKCVDERRYICQTNKDIIEQIEIFGHVLNEEPITEHHKFNDNTETGSATTAVIVVISTIAIVAIVATVLYKWHGKKTSAEGGERVRFHNHD